VLLDTVPVYRLADIFVASFEISFEEQLSMLDSVDLKVRLSKANELVDRHLQVQILYSYSIINVVVLPFVLLRLISIFFL
jgi:hypothetical protein